MRLNETTTGWNITAEDARLELIQIDYRLGLIVSDGHSSLSVYIETACRLKSDKAEHVIVPEEQQTIAPILPLFNVVVNDVVFNKTGNLRIHFASGHTIAVDPDASFEAWQITVLAGKEQCMFVCSPGGEVAVFTQREPSSGGTRA